MTESIGMVFRLLADGCLTQMGWGSHCGVPAPVAAHSPPGHCRTAVEAIPLLTSALEVPLLLLCVGAGVGKAWGEIFCSIFITYYMYCKIHVL